MTTEHTTPDLILWGVCQFRSELAGFLMKHVADGGATRCSWCDTPYDPPAPDGAA